MYLPPATVKPRACRWFRRCEAQGAHLGPLKRVAGRTCTHGPTVVGAPPPSQLAQPQSPLHRQGLRGR